MVAVWQKAIRLSADFRLRKWNHITLPRHADVTRADYVPTQKNARDTIFSSIESQYKLTSWLHSIHEGCPHQENTPMHSNQQLPQDKRSRTQPHLRRECESASGHILEPFVEPVS
jgi:hypothetical protein